MGFFDELKQAGNSILEELQSDVADALDVRRTPLQKRTSTHRRDTRLVPRYGCMGTRIHTTGSGHTVQLVNCN